MNVQTAYMTAPDEAVVTSVGNPKTSAERVHEMALLRCAKVTLQHGYRYFVVTNAAELSRAIADVVKPGVELSIIEFLAVPRYMYR